MLIRHDPLVLWESDGATNLTVVSGTKYWFTMSGGVGAFTADASIQTTYWFEIPLQGADYLALQYMSKLNAVGTITAVTGSDVEIAAQGMMLADDSDPDLAKPHALFAAQTPSATHGDPPFSTFPLFTTKISLGKLNGDINAYSSLIAQGESVVAPGPVNVPHVRGAIFLQGGIPEAPHPASLTPLTTHYPGWMTWVNARTAYQQNAGLAFQEYPPISCYHKAWVAVSHTSTFAGAGPVQIRGKLVALRYTKGPVS